MHHSRRTFIATAAASYGAMSSLSGCLNPGSGQTDSHPDGDSSSSQGEHVTVTKDGASSTDEDPENGAFGSIQGALEAAEPGDTVRVPPGTYQEKITTVRSGTEDKPITITGPETAVVRGNRDDYGLVRIHHSHIHVRGLTIEGLLDPEHPDELSSYVEGQLIQTRPPTTTDAYLRDVVIAPHNIGYSRKSLIGLERTKDAEIGPLRVTGLAGADYTVGNERDHNGELLYIGTSPSNLGTDWHPWTELDETRNVHIHHIDNSAGHAHAEAVDLKPGTRNITVEYMTDRNGGRVATDDTPTAISFKSHDATVRWCEIIDAPIGVEFDGDHPEQVYNNDLYQCRIRGYTDEPVMFDSGSGGPEHQGTLCGNVVEGFDGPRPQACSAEVPTSDGIGHTGGASPWS